MKVIQALLISLADLFHAFLFQSAVIRVFDGPAEHVGLAVPAPHGILEARPADQQVRKAFADRLKSVRHDAGKAELSA